MPDATLPDIRDAADIDRLVAAFYGRLLADPIVGFFFTDISPIELEHHLPTISAFWRQQLLGQPGYRGQTFAVHRRLHERSPLLPEHFHRWLFVFETSVDALFAGPLATAAKLRARRIATSMQEALATRHSQSPAAEASVEARIFTPTAAG